MFQVIRIIAWAGLAVGVSIADSESLFIPIIMVILGAALLKLSEIIDKEAHK